MGGFGEEICKFNIADLNALIKTFSLWGKICQKFQWGTIWSL